MEEIAGDICLNIAIKIVYVVVFTLIQYLNLGIFDVFYVLDIHKLKKPKHEQQNC